MNSHDSAPAVEVHDLRKAYGELEAVHGVSFEIARGEVFCLLGPNGAGKTSIVEILEGYRTRTGGEARVLGIDPATGARALRERVGIVLQQCGVQTDLTVAELIEMYGRYHVRSRGVDEILGLVELTEKREVRAKQLSGGQRSLAFTKEAWELAGGFPERLHWVEDGVFGRNVARHRRCAFAADALVSWRQRGSAKATLYMYLTYGRGAARSGERQLIARDLARLLAYIGATAAVIRGRRGRIAVLTGGAAYLSVPLTRVIRYRAGLASGICVPVVLAAKDFGKVGGALSALLFPGEDLRSQWPPWRTGRAHRSGSERNPMATSEAVTVSCPTAS